jgi:hypothetical protein
MNEGYRLDARGSSTFAPIPSTLRWITLGLVVMMTLGFIASVSLWTFALASSPRHPDDDLLGAGALALGGTVLLVYVQAAIGVAWMHKAWSWLPPQERYARHWRTWITPAQAAFFLLIPYFQYYWMFVVNCGLCDSFDRLRVRYGTREPAPKTLAIAASVFQIVLPVPVAAICWLIFMSKIERMSLEMTGRT